ncbi:MAG: hypothetical protein WKG07_45675 [Hymenobacter sp.]
MTPITDISQLDPSGSYSYADYLSVALYGIRGADYAASVLRKMSAPVTGAPASCSTESSRASCGTTSEGKSMPGVRRALRRAPAPQHRQRRRAGEHRGAARPLR